MSLHPDFLTRPVAHRALHDHSRGRPENSRAAVRAAVAAGYAIEIDLQPSADNVAMVFHDPILDRMTAETGPVSARSAADLGAIRLHDAEDGIPTLAEVLKLVAGRVPLLIELKDQSGLMGADMGPLPAATAAALQGYGGPVAVMSFNPHAVAEMAKLAPRIPRGLTTYDWVRDRANFVAEVPGVDRARLTAIADYDDVGACFISHYRRDLTHPRVSALKSMGTPILCWTIKSRDQEAKARQIADNITFERYEAAFPADNP